MTNNTDPVRALVGQWRDAAEFFKGDAGSDIRETLMACASELEAALAQQPPSAPVGVEAVRGAWLAAITLANNICVQESDRENDRDGDTGWIDGTAECAKRIREYAHPTDAELLEMLDEAGANAAKAALAQQPAAVDEAMVELARKARRLQRDHFGDGMSLHLAMMDWAREYDALATKRQEPTT